MLDNDIRELIINELVDFVDSYIMINGITYGDLNTEFKDGKYIKFGVYGCYQHQFKHGVIKRGRTKLFFKFRFEKDELFFAIKLNKVLDSYVDYEFKDYGDDYLYCFTIDVNSKKHANDLLNRISLKNNC